MVINKGIMVKRLSDLPKTSVFTRYMKPDNMIPTPEAALENKDDIIHRPHILRLGTFSWSLPEKRAEYRYLTSSDRAFEDLGLDESNQEDPEFQQVMSGEWYLDGENFIKKGYPFPYAQAYTGYQFGLFAGQLGDGRVLNLFELPKPFKDQSNRGFYEMQIKGLGKTPFSRFADGKAVLRSSIREYIMSEHLNAVGIPSTRALTLTYLPKTFAQRYGAEKCAILSRFAESWARLGSFHMYRMRGERDEARKMSDYVIKELFTVEGKEFGYFNELMNTKNDFFEDGKNTIGELTRYDLMYLETVVRNAITVAYWQAYGFLNGVLNTDNTSILGLSLDFGPFSIMDRFDPNFTPNSEDHDHRYSYRNTPASIWWNLTRFGEDVCELIGAGNSLVDDPFFKDQGIKEEWEEPIIKRAAKIIEVGGEVYMYAFTKAYVEIMFARLGLPFSAINYDSPSIHIEELIEPLLKILSRVETDYNLFFASFMESNADEPNTNLERLTDKVLYFDSQEKMEDPTGYPKAEVIKEFGAWLEQYRRLFEHARMGDEEYNSKELAKRYNPLFLPRNWILEEVIAYTQQHDAEDLSYLKKLEKMSFHPYDKSKWGDELKELESKWLLQSNMGSEYSMLQCSCSS